MTPSGEGRGASHREPSHDAVVAALRRRVDEERRRAARAEALAVSCEERIEDAPERLRDIRIWMASLHRQAEIRHKTSALLHELHAVRLEVWRAAGNEPASRPGFMATVAAAIGVPSATASIRGRRPATIVASSSDETARSAHDLEVALGEGPALAAMAEATSVSAGGSSLAERWPLFGPAVADLGVRSVLAVPMRSAAVCVGALCVYGQEPAVHDTVKTVTGRIAEAVTHTVLGGAVPDSGDGLPADQLFGEADYQPVVHQAAGAVAAWFGWGIDDAEDLLRARAFTDSRPVADIAAAVLRGEIRLA